MDSLSCFRNYFLKNQIRDCLFYSKFVQKRKRIHIQTDDMLIAGMYYTYTCAAPSTTFTHKYMRTFAANDDKFFQFISVKVKLDKADSSIYLFLFCWLLSMSTNNVTLEIQSSIIRCEVIKNV